MSPFPNHWTTKSLGDLCEVIRGGSPRPMGDPRYFTGTIPFLKIADITKIPGKFVFDSQTKVNELGAEKSRLLPKGTLVLTNSATVCVPKFLGVDACIHDGFVAFQNFTREVDLNYLYHFFDYTRPYVVQKHKQGVTQVNLNIEIVNGFEVPLPSIDEQERIVAKIEELFSELDAGVESLKKAQAQLKTYRQAVLKSAFEGNLTKDWRKERDSVVSGNLLAEKIEKERIAQTAKTGKRAKPVEPLTELEIESLSTLPSTWTWIRLGNIVWSVKDGPHYSPKYKEAGIPFISGGNIRPDGIDFVKCKFISPELHKELSVRCKPEINDVLYTKGGTTGIARVNTYEIEFNVWVHVAVLKLVESVDPFYLQHALNSNHCYQQAQKYTHGVGNQDLGLTRMVLITLPMCSIEEQKQVVEEIESRLSVCDKLEENIAASLKQSEALRQSILKQAFEGKLVDSVPPVNLD